ncbi:UNVERIFIED_CONTAM: hypothetical protein HDU68_010271 [Siphonaria sp. JEL0065]|nr:hypothetical protein HDU68_010271 [Siphonaria sp. JEL0065]
MTDKQYHVFVSYSARVGSDAAVAETLTDKLQTISILGEPRTIHLRAFVDFQNFEEKAAGDGIRQSCLFLPIVSTAALSSDLTKDNALVNECETAIALARQGIVDILPLFVGSFGPDGKEYTRFDGASLLAKIPPSGTKDTLNAILSYEGVFVNPSQLADKVAVIQSRFSYEIWRKYRQFYTNKAELGPDQVFSCVQCGGEFKESENGEGSCRFHAKSYGGCCGNRSDQGCQRGRHTNTHHNAYLYAALWDWRNGLVNYTNMRALFAVVVADDFKASTNPDRTVNASVGAILSDASDKDSDRLFVDARCGSNGLFFQTFSKTEILSINSQTPIFGLKGPDGEQALGKWVTNDAGTVIGVCLEVSTKTTPQPSSATVLFEWPVPSLNNGPVATQTTFSSTPQFGELPLPVSLSSSNNPYNFDTSKLVGGTPIPERIPRKRDLELPSYSSPTSNFSLKVLETTVRHDGYRKIDYLCVEVALLNKGKEANLVVDGRAFAKLRVVESTPLLIKERGEGDEDGADFVATGEWKVLEKANWSVRNSDNARLPTSVPSMGTATLFLNAEIPTTRYYDDDKSGNNFDFSWISYRSGVPLLLDLELEDVEGGKFGVVVEFPLPDLYLKKAGKDALFLLETDDAAVCDREVLQIIIKDEPVYDSEFLDPVYSRDRTTQYEGKFIYTSSVHLLTSFASYFTVSWTNRSATLTIPTFRHIILQAESKLSGSPLSTHLYVHDITDLLFESESKDTQFRHSAFAIIDFSRRAVVAIRFTTESRGMKSVGYFNVPPYGDALSGEAKDFSLGLLDETDAFIKAWFEEEKGLVKQISRGEPLKQGKPPVSLRGGVGSVGNQATSENTSSLGAGNSLPEVLKPLLSEFAKDIEDRVSASFKREIQVLVDRIKELELKQK